MKSIIRISDGLGNQLFQYAFGYSVHKKMGMEIILDPVYTGTLRNYQLDAFQLEYNTRYINDKIDYLLGIGPRKAGKPRRKYRYLKTRLNGYQIIQENKEMQYDESVYMDKAAYYCGFWQSWRYFDQYYEEIKRQYTQKNAIGDYARQLCDKMRMCNSVSCHIRRTDYNREVNNVCLQDDFYKKALDKMGGQFELFVFTDDKQFVKDNFKLHDYTIVDNTSDLEDFYLMQQCRNHIIANSTFSWWGAYLAENKGGIVCAPIANIWTRDFYLPTWNCIETSIGDMSGNWMKA